MPSELDLPYHVQDNIASQPQAKLCTSCHATLVDLATISFQDSQVICALCRPLPPADTRHPRSTQESSYPLRQRSHEALSLPNTRRSQDPIAAYDTTHTEPYLAYTKKPPPFVVQCSTALSTLSQRHQQSHYVSSPSYDTGDHACNNSNRTQQQQHRSTTGDSAISPDPLADLTRLRIRTRPHQCLYPGALFQGTQKSGRNSYDVSVTIVDINFPASTLCGYLRIRGLTDDWPELTTYFDAEMIGSRYGFLTQNWGATQNEDLMHWSRFPPFKHIRHEAKHPHMTMDDRDRGVVFMRWKERFLVPDHRVQDINGASFAGFYYVCVDFNPQPAPLLAPTPAERCPSLSFPHTRGGPDDSRYCSSQPISVPDAETRPRCPRDSSLKRRGPPLTPPSLPLPSMTGFYYHQNSEPYQQLSLVHVPEQTTSTFEFR